MKKLETILPKPGIVRITIALVFAVVVLAGSAYTTIQITRNRLEDYANRMAEQQSDYVNIVTNMTFISSAWVVNSFMAGFTDVESIVVDSTSHLPVTHSVMSDKTLQRFTTDEIYLMLEAFISYHYDYASVMMIFEPGVIKDAPDGIAALVRSGDSKRYNILHKLNIFDSRFYKSVKKCGNYVSHENYVSNDSIFVLTAGIPIYDSRGNIIGEFWLDTDANTYSEVLNLYKSDDDVSVVLINKEGLVLSSSNREHNGLYLKDAIAEVYDFEVLKEWYSQVMSLIKTNKENHFRCQIGDDYLVTYVFPVQNSQYNLLIVKPENAVYSAVQRFIWSPIIILVISILLVSLSLVYIYFVFRRQNRESFRMKSELNVAANIQRKILPPNPSSSSSSSLSSSLLSYEVFGYQKSAKTVGGDLYDFVQKGDYLHFCIGDVSGKGMPAALVMSEICSLYRYIITHCTDPADIVTRMNKAVMERSDNSMFCTLFVGVLNLRTGLLQFCNAGHNPPIFIPSSSSSLSSSLSSSSSVVRVKPNIVLFAFDDFVYQSESLQLTPGDRLYLYTDGVTEARNESNQFYGETATLASVQRLKDKPFDELVSGILADLKSFTRKAEQNDDITMLCVEYKGSDTTLHFDAVKGHVSDIVNAILDTCDMTEDMRFRLAIEEPVQNIANYAYTDDGPVDVVISRDSEYITITIIDSGKPFNPLEAAAPDLSVPVMEREVGGLGIFLTRKVMADISYSYENNNNRLNLKYKI